MALRRKGGLLLVPYVGEYPEEAVDGLIMSGAEGYGWAVDIELIGPEHHAYHDKLNELWTLCAMAKTDLMIVEGDTVIHNKVFDSFEECENDYCVFTYWIGARYGYGLGCTRFRSSLISTNPDLVRVAGLRTNDGLPVVAHHKRMDTRICDEATERGLLKKNLGGHFAPCVHEPPVKHLHVYPMPEPEPGANVAEAGRKFIDNLGG